MPVRVSKLPCECTAGGQSIRLGGAGIASRSFGPSWTANEPRTTSCRQSCCTSRPPESTSSKRAPVTRPSCLARCSALPCPALLLRLTGAHQAEQAAKAAVKHTEELKAEVDLLQERLRAMCIKMEKERGRADQAEQQLWEYCVRQSQAAVSESPHEAAVHQIRSSVVSDARSPHQKQMASVGKLHLSHSSQDNDVQYRY